MTENLTKQDFLDKVFDYENEEEWKYKGDTPAIIDFWAEWCGPCKQLAPTVEAVAAEKSETLKVCKMDVDSNREIAANEISVLLFFILIIPLKIFFFLLSKLCFHQLTG